MGNRPFNIVVFDDNVFDADLAQLWAEAGVETESWGAASKQVETWSTVTKEGEAYTVKPNVTPFEERGPD